MRPFRLWSRFRCWTLSAPVRLKIMGIALGVIFLLGLAMTLQVRATLTGRMLEELEQRGVAVTRDVAGRAADLILTDNLFALQELVRTTMENNEDARYVFIVGRDGRILAHTFGEHFPPDLLVVNAAGPPARSRVELLETEEGLIHDLAVSILDGKAGVARVGMSERRLGEVVQGTTWLLLLVTVVVSLVGVAGAYLLTLVLTRPILQLVEVTRAVGRGDFSQQAPVWATDEIGRLSAAFNAMTEALARSRQEIEAYNRQLVRRNEELSVLYEEVQRKEELLRQLLEKLILAQEEERKRVARELHDEVGQSLTAVIMGLGTAEEGLPAELLPMRTQLARLQDLAAKTLEGIRRLMVDLRPTLLDDLGLIPAIQWYAETHLAPAGVAPTVEVVGPRRRLPPLVETALFRVAQEGITNIVKHAAASRATVRLEFRPASIAAAIEDDGTGFTRQEPRDGRGLGLMGMQERVTLLGGTLRLSSDQGRGTRIAIEIPLPDQGEEALASSHLRTNSHSLRHTP
ncbi:MAG: HAMP domain-containing protein [Chloroflexi bacterium]|nr:HAMP domain-containing protein [Chloroflexota bacterium]